MRHGKTEEQLGELVWESEGELPKEKDEMLEVEQHWEKELVEPRQEAE